MKEDHVSVVAFQESQRQAGIKDKITEIMTWVLGDTQIGLGRGQRSPRLQEMVVWRVRALLPSLRPRSQGRRQAHLLPALLAFVESRAAVDIGDIIVIAMCQRLDRVVRPRRRDTDMKHDIGSTAMRSRVVLQDSREGFANGRVSDWDRSRMHMKGDAAVITLGRREGERRREGRGDQIGGINEICLKGLVTRSVGFGFGFESDPVLSLTPNPVISTEISLGAGCG